MRDQSIGINTPKIRAGRRERVIGVYSTPLSDR
ncbi:MAG: hypothetical protein RIR66_451 [Actinomycetota bacterium]|jgi:hypothetical protein